MSDEKELAKNVLATVARPIAIQSVEFGDKLAVGTGAALVLIISQLSDLKDFIPPLSLFASSVLAIVSLLVYMIARYRAIQATVLADAEKNLIAISRSVPNNVPFDEKSYHGHTVDLSVWPATWAISFAEWRATKWPDGKNDLVVSVIRNSQRVTRYIALQVISMFAALLVLIGSFTFNNKPIALSSSPASKESPTLITIYLDRSR